MSAQKSKKRSVFNGRMDTAGLKKATGQRDSGRAGNAGYPPVQTAGGRKRPSLNDPLDLGDDSEGADVSTMLDRFNADVNNAFVAKRKRLEMFTKSTLKSSHQMVERMWKAQQSDRTKMTENYSSQLNAVFEQWDTDVQKSKDQEGKLSSLFRQQQQMFQHMRTSQGQRLKSTKQLLNQYIQSLEELQRKHSEHHTAFQTELRQEMIVLQNKILADTQHQDMASMRKSIHAILS